LGETGFATAASKSSRGSNISNLTNSSLDTNVVLPSAVSNDDWYEIVSLSDDAASHVKKFTAHSGPIYSPDSAKPIDYFNQFFYL